MTMTALAGASLGLIVFASVQGNATRSTPAISHEQDYRLTHELVACGPVPTALDPNGVYPYVSYCETSNRPVLARYDFIVLENDQLRVTV